MGTETVTMGVPQQTILTREVGEVGVAAGTVLACEAPSVLCSMSVTETVGATGVALVTETVTRTEQSLRVRALEAPPPAQAIKVTGVGRYVPVQCQPGSGHDNRIYQCWQTAQESLFMLEYLCHLWF